MSTLVNIARMTTSTTGTGTVTLGSAVASFLTFALAGVTNGMTVTYLIEDGNGTGREVGTGTYTSSGTTLTRTVTNSTNGGAAISLSGSAQVALTALVADITNKAGDTMTGALNWATAVTIASSSSVAIGAAASNYVIISGTATITSFDTIAQGAFRWIRFSGAATLTHNGTSLILPNAADILCVAGDWCLAESEGSGNWRVVFYNRAVGIYINAGLVGIGTTAPTSKLTVSLNTAALPAATTGTLLHMGQADTVSTRILLDGFAATPSFSGRHAAGTAASPTASQINNTLVAMAGFGYGATGYATTNRGSVLLCAAEAWTDSAQGTYLAFNTTATGATTAGGTERMRIDNAGNVGIGTTSPGVSLQVNGTIRAATANGSGILSLGESAGGTTVNVGVWRGLANSLSAGNLLNLGGYDGITFATGNTVIGSQTQRMVIDTSGNVGIGTTAPIAKLDVLGSGTTNVEGDDAQDAIIQGPTIAITGNSANLVVASNSTAATDAGGTIGFAGRWSTTAQAIFGVIKGGKENGSTEYGGYLAFGTRTHGNSIAERMRISPAGNVGIGLTGPVNKLDVTGSIGWGAPVTKTNDFSLAATENWVINNRAATNTVTLPAASSWTGRVVTLSTIQAQTVVSASGNVVPLIGGAAGTAILAGTAGKWATLVSDGTNWTIMAGN